MRQVGRRLADRNRTHAVSQSTPYEDPVVFRLDQHDVRPSLGDSKVKGRDRSVGVVDMDDGKVWSRDGASRPFRIHVSAVRLDEQARGAERDPNIPGEIDEPQTGFNEALAGPGN